MKYLLDGREDLTEASRDVQLQLASLMLYKEAGKVTRNGPIAGQRAPCHGTPVFQRMFPEWNAGITNYLIWIDQSKNEFSPFYQTIKSELE